MSSFDHSVIENAECIPDIQGKSVKTGFFCLGEKRRRASFAAAPDDRTGPGKRCGKQLAPEQNPRDSEPVTPPCQSGHRGLLGVIHPFRVDNRIG